MKDYSDEVMRKCQSAEKLPDGTDKHKIRSQVSGAPASPCVSTASVSKALAKGFS